jgi:hypothetical protein
MRSEVITVSEEEDANLARIDELIAKQDSGGELTAEEQEFLDRMAADPNYPIDVEEDYDW